MGVSCVRTTQVDSHLSCRIEKIVNASASKLRKLKTDIPESENLSNNT